VEGFCQKDNVMVDLESGCRHPNDYCQYRQACIIHFHELEQRRKRKNIVETNGRHEKQSRGMVGMQNEGPANK